MITKKPLNGGNWWLAAIARLQKKYANWVYAQRHHNRKPNPPPAPPKPAPPGQPISMFDDVNTKLIPKNAPAVAGYVGGRWPNYRAVVAGWPHAHHLSIAVASYQDADCLDVEPGDAPISLAPGWVKRQHARGKKRPVLYTSASWGQKLIDTCSKAGLKYGRDYLWWSAHYTFHPHFCGPGCGFGIRETAHATQWTDMALGRHLDQSICSPGFFT